MVLCGGFCIFLAVYETFEYLFCYDDEKKLHRRLYKLSLRARELTNSSQPSTQQPESQALLNDQSEETIQMEELSTNQHGDYGEISANQSEDFSEREEGQRLVSSEIGQSAEEEQCQRIAQKFTEGLNVRRKDSDEESST